MVQLIPFALTCPIYFYQAPDIRNTLSTKILYEPLFSAVQKSEVSSSSLKCLLTLANKKIWLAGQEYFSANSWQPLLITAYFLKCLQSLVQLFSIGFSLKSTTKHVSDNVPNICSTFVKSDNYLLYLCCFSNPLWFLNFPLCGSIH